MTDTPHSPEAGGDFTIQTRATGARLLVLSESHHSGWRVSVDHAPAEVIRVYGAFLGCRLEAGLHEVHFYFAPQSLRTGFALTGLGLALLAVWCGVELAQARRRASPQTSGERP
jgi:uncharacterized membrane protein YfhO